MVKHPKTLSLSSESITLVISEAISLDSKTTSFNTG